MPQLFVLMHRGYLADKGLDAGFRGKILRDFYPHTYMSRCSICMRAVCALNFCVCVYIVCAHGCVFFDLCVLGHSHFLDFCDLDLDFNLHVPVLEPSFCSSLGLCFGVSFYDAYVVVVSPREPRRFALES